MKVTPEFEAALHALLKAEMEMMRRHKKNSAECWAWGQCRVVDLERSNGDYNTGDVLHLREWNPETKEYTGEDLYRIVTYIMRGPAFGLKEGWVCMGIRE